MSVFRSFLFLFILFFSFSSCNKAVNFNNKLVEIQKSVQQEMKDFSIKTQNKHPESLSAESLKMSAEKATGFINDKIKEAEDLLVPKNGGDLKEAIINQLKFEKEIVEQIGRLSDPQLSAEEKAQIETGFLNSSEKAKVLEEKVRSSQEAFAKEHEFKLENK